MSRRVPEFAVLVGVFFGLSAVVFGLVLGWGLLATTVVAAVGAYPFVAFGLLRDDDPAADVPPRWILLAGAGWSLFGVLGVLLEDASPTALPVAAVVGLLLFLPPAAYAARYDAGVNPLTPRQTLATGVVVAAGCLVVGLLVGRPVPAVVAAVLVAVAAGVYATARGVRFDARTRRGAVAAGAVVGLAIVAVGVVRGGRPADWVLVGVGVAFVPSLYVVLSRENRTRR